MPGLTEAHNATGWCNHSRDYAPPDFRSVLPHDPVVVLLIIVLVLMTLFSIVANVLTLLSIGSSDDLTWQPRFTFCRNLIISDLLQTLTFGPPVIYLLANRQTMPFGFWCYAQYFVGGVSIFCSLVTITCMALERYLFICYALRYTVILTDRRLRAALALIWLYSVAVTTAAVAVLLLEPGEEGGDARMFSLLCEPDTLEKHLGSPRASVQFRKAIGSLTLLLCVLAHVFSYHKMYRMGVRAVAPFKAANVKARNTVGFYCAMLLLQLLPAISKVTADAVRDLGAMETPGSPSEPCGTEPALSSAAAFLHVAFLVSLQVPPCINPLVYGVKNVEIRRALSKMFRWRPADRFRVQAPAEGIRMRSIAK
ncbi:olfactory receptor 1B1 [Menidia menidia]